MANKMMSPGALKTDDSEATPVAHNLAQPARWRRRKSARPQEILQAALHVFAHKGFAAARMEDISQRAGVTKGTLYLYFESKDALFKALVRDSISPSVQDVFQQARDLDSSCPALLKIALRSFSDFMRHSDLIVLPKIVIAEAGNFPALARYYRSEIIDVVLGVLEELIAQGVARGELRNIDPKHAARLCVAPLMLSGFWRITFDPLDDTPYDHAGLIETHIDIFMRGLSAKGA